MAFTSFSPNDERFGFSTKGSFRCAYENQRLVIIGFFIALGIMAAGAVIILIAVWDMITTPPDISEYDGTRIGLFAFNTGIYGSYVIAVAAIVIIIILTLIAFAITLTVLHAGRIHEFKANEVYFEIIPPDPTIPHTIIYYDDVIMVYAEERKFLFTEHGLDVTVRTKKGNLFFRYVHTTESKMNGLPDTPFNILMERAGLVSRPDFNI